MLDKMAVVNPHIPMMAFLQKLLVGFFLVQAALGKARTSPPSGAVVVRAGTSKLGEYSNITAAVNSLPADGSAQTIFVYPGTYKEQVYITRNGSLTVYGYTHNTNTYIENTVTISAGINASRAGSNDASGTLRIHANDFSLYNIDVENTYGPGVQAIALSQYGSRVGLYASSFKGYQDTLYASVGTQVYLKSYIEGAVDFIFGRQGLAFFGGNTIAVTGPGYITASGRQTDDAGSYVFDKNTIILAPHADWNTTGNTFLGRPWAVVRRVIFKNTDVEARINKTIWSIWNPGDERTDNITFAEYKTYGPGVAHADRPAFSTMLDSSEAALYNISSAVGNDYASWVDAAYL